MMMRLVVAIALVGIVAGAHDTQAQSTADLQAIGQQAAAQYGVPWPILQAQIQGESSWNPNVGCNSRGACGIAQFLPGTAATYGVNVNDTTSSLYGAAQYDAALYQQKGSWVGALTAYSGGLTAADPKSYAGAFQAAQAADAGGVTPVATNPGTVPGSPTVTAIGSTITSQPFATAWNFVQGTLVGQLQQATARTLTMAQAPLSLILMLMVIVCGIGTTYGRMSVQELSSRVGRIIVIVGILKAGTFNEYVTQFLLVGLPQWIAANLSPAGAASSPAGPFDSAMLNFWNAAHEIWKETAWRDTLFMGLVLFACMVIVGLALLGMFMVFLTVTSLMSLVVVIAPLVVPALFFNYTRRFFDGMISVVVSLAGAIVLVDAVVQILSGAITQWLAALHASQDAWSDAVNLCGVATLVLILGSTVLVLPRVVESIGGAAAGIRMVAPFAVAHSAGRAARRAGRTIFS